MRAALDGVDFLFTECRRIAKAFMFEAERSKTNRPRTIPMLSQRLRGLLKERRTGADGQPLGREAYIFGNEVGEEVGEFKRAWNTACRRGGIANLHFHDLRRECPLAGGRCRVADGLFPVPAGSHQCDDHQHPPGELARPGEAELRAYDAKRAVFPNLSRSSPSPAPHDEPATQAVH